MILLNKLQSTLFNFIQLYSNLINLNQPPNGCFPKASRIVKITKAGIAGKLDRGVVDGMHNHPGIPRDRVCEGFLATLVALHFTPVSK